MKIFGYLDDIMLRIAGLPLWAKIILGIVVMFIIFYLYGRFRTTTPF